MCIYYDILAGVAFIYHYSFCIQMEIQQNVNNTKEYKYTCRKVLKSGQIKEYQYERTITGATPSKKMGKNKLREKINNCNDKDKIALVLAYMISIGL